MFEGSEYESYVTLCRTLRLERASQPGDCVLRCESGAPRHPYDIEVMGSHGGGFGEAPFHDDSYEIVWLPRLDQWLAMLVRVDPEYSRDIAIQWRRDGWYIARYVNDWCKGPTLEEAAARLWMAVTGASAA